MLTTRIAAKTSGAAVSVAAGYGYWLIKTDEGANRAFRAYSTMIPVVAHYRFAEFRNKYFYEMTEDDWTDLDERYAVRTVQRLAELQGVCMFVIVFATRTQD